MYSAAADFFSIFIIKFENLIVSQITFDCLYVSSIYFFSSIKAKMLDIVRTMQAPTLGRFFIQQKQGFSQGSNKLGTFSLKYGPGSDSGL